MIHDLAFWDKVYLCVIACDDMDTAAAATVADEADALRWERVQATPPPLELQERLRHVSDAGLDAFDVYDAELTERWGLERVRHATAFIRAERAAKVAA